MKRFACLMCVGMLFTSCNTTIGVGRDIRDGYQWTKGKIQESQQGESYDQGPPVY